MELVLHTIRLGSDPLVAANQAGPASVSALCGSTAISTIVCLGVASERVSVPPIALVYCTSSYKMNFIYGLIKTNRSFVLTSF
ncbi:MAG: hypothetical protein M3539_14095 [Acidobacteriota bacterium]|nr:hypothetical protein [Acidobacteriota bacterium]